jgi:thermitase
VTRFKSARDRANKLNSVGHNFVSKILTVITTTLTGTLSLGSVVLANHSESLLSEAIAPSQALVQIDPQYLAKDLFSSQHFQPIGDPEANLYLLELDPFVPTAVQIRKLNLQIGIEFAEPNFLLSVLSEPDDPFYLDGSTWGLYGSGSSTSSIAGINASSAWADGYTGDNSVYVAVIDSGIDVSHPDLSGNVWTNEAEIAGNGIDDDGNGWIDDIHGYDFLNDDGSVFDVGESPHGTHVAGIIGAEGNNGIGVAGVNWNVKLISAKIINSAGNATTANAISAIDYITNLRTQKGLDIIATNNSWGGKAYSRALEEAIQRGGDAGIIFVASSGNSGANLNNSPHYPAAYDCTTSHRLFDCVVSVAAINEDGSLASYSNFGSRTVDIAAPGTNILSTLPNDDYGILSGT